MLLTLLPLLLRRRKRYVKFPNRKADRQRQRQRATETETDRKDVVPTCGVKGISAVLSSRLSLSGVLARFLALPSLELILVSRCFGVFSRLDGVFSCLDGVFTRLVGVFSRLVGVFSRLVGVFSRLDGVFFLEDLSLETDEISSLEDLSSFADFLSLANLASLLESEGGDS